jgi:AcrR family transcriptional regulator
VKSSGEKRSYQQRARADATAATRARVIDAMLAQLSRRWLEEISLQEVADGAQTSLQTVLRHFGSKEGLIGAALAAIEGRVAAARALPAGAPLEAVLRVLVRDYERSGDLYIRGTMQEHRSAQMAPVIAHARRSHRAWLEGALADELRRVPGARRAAALDGLFAATDVLLWKILRRDLRMPSAAVERWMISLARAVLDGVVGADAKPGARCAGAPGFPHIVVD